MFENDISTVKLSNDNLLFTGEVEKISMWDLRTSHLKPKSYYELPVGNI